MDDWKAKRAARASMASALRAANPGLVSADGKGGALVAAAKNIRIELAKAFSGVKFSVKSSRYSGGNSITVSWIDGPVSAQVDEIIGRYKAGSFNGMDDSYSYVESAWTDAFGDANYVFTSRSDSDLAIASAIRSACAKWGADRISVEDYKAGKARLIRQANFGHFDLGDLIYQVMCRRTWALSKAAKVKSEEMAA